MIGRLGPLAFVSAVMLAACGGSGGSGSDELTTAAPSATTASTSSTGATPVGPVPSSGPTDSSGSTSSATAGTSPDGTEVAAPDASHSRGRVVALAEEFLLADLLALGVIPVASPATVEDAGFQGIDADTSSIEVLPQTTLSLEYLASLQPDTIVTFQFWVDQVGPGVLEAMADVIVLPDGLSAVERLTDLAGRLGLEDRAAAAVAEVEAARAAAREAVGGDCAVSLATVYSGPTVAAFVSGPWELPAAFSDVGCELHPSADDVGSDANGRAWLSEEQLGVLDQDVLVLFQSESVEGESDALDAVTASPLWATLPAVAAGHVVVVDRLGYPGVEGLIRFYRELPSIVGAG